MITSNVILRTFHLSHRHQRPHVAGLHRRNGPRGGPVRANDGGWMPSTYPMKVYRR